MKLIKYIAVLVMLAAMLTACGGKKASYYNKEGMKYYDSEKSHRSRKEQQDL